MADKEKQVTVRFESTIENPEDDERASYVKVERDENGNRFFNNNLEYYIYNEKDKKYELALELDDKTNELVNIKKFDPNKEYYVLTYTHMLSGPIEIFATVNGISELSGEEIRSAILQEYGTRLKESTDNDVDLPSIVVFVENVTKLSMNNPNHRGAYFYFKGNYNQLLDDSYWGEYTKVDTSKLIKPESGVVYYKFDSLKKEYYVSEDEYFKHGVDYYVIDKEKALLLWKEILLGTHSHHNAELLEKLEDVFDLKDGKIVFRDGVLDYLTGKCKCLPDLPEDIKAKINELKKLDLDEPTNSEYHHLDAPLDQLVNTYDWLFRDKNGNYSNIAVGNCREVYLEVMKADKKLYLLKTKDGYTISKPVYDSELKKWVAPEDTIGWLRLDAELLNFSDEEIPDSVEVKQSKTNSKYNIISFETPWNILEDDNLFLFLEDEYISEDKYKLSYNENKVTVELRKSDFNYNDTKRLTLVAACDTDPKRFDKNDFIDSVKDGEIRLNDINNLLTQLYIEGEFSRKPKVPHLYLTTDDYGRFHWDNMLIPSQTFYTGSIDVTDKLYEKNHKDGYFLAEFETTYKANENFPILMVDDMFAFNVTPVAKENGTVEFKIPDDSHFEVQPGTKITLVMISKAVAGDIAEEMAENYVSKADAVKILSHGKLDLRDYATMSQLANYARMNHVHNQYALKYHNHDNRYANFRHTHPELLKAVADLIASLNLDYIEADPQPVEDDFFKLVTEFETGYVKVIDKDNLDTSKDYYIKKEIYVKDDNLEDVYRKEYRYYKCNIESGKVVDVVCNCEICNNMPVDEADLYEIGNVGLIDIENNTYYIKTDDGYEEIDKDNFNFSKFENYYEKAAPSGYYVKEGETYRYLNDSDVFDSNETYYVTNSKIIDKLNELSEEEQKKYTQYVDGIIANSGIEKEYEYDEDGNPILDSDGNHSFHYIISDRNITLSEDVFNQINESLMENGLEALPEGATVNDALKMLALLFQKDTVKDNQVLLDQAIPVRLKNGPIGGIDTNRIYEKGTTLQKILQDIFDPYVEADRVAEDLTPTEEDIKIHWYVAGADEGDYIEIDPEHMNEVYEDAQLYYDVEVINPKKYTVINSETGEDVEIHTIISDTAEANADGKVPYTDGDITLEYTSDIPVTDNYGFNEIEFGGELVIPVELKYDYTDYYIGGVAEETVDPKTSLDGYFIEAGEKYINIKAGSNYIVFYIEHGLTEAKNVIVSIKDAATNTEIFPFFNEIEDAVHYGDIVYYGYSYELMDNRDPVLLKIAINKIGGDHE